MKVIITGGGGFLGSQLAEALLVRGELINAEVLVLDLFIFRGFRPLQLTGLWRHCGSTGPL